MEIILIIVLLKTKLGYQLYNLFIDLVLFSCEFLPVLLIFHILYYSSLIYDKKGEETLLKLNGTMSCMRKQKTNFFSSYKKKLHITEPRL